MKTLLKIEKKEAAKPHPPADSGKRGVQPKRPLKGRPPQPVTSPKSKLFTNSP
jgi:hypothetical protein